MELFASFLSLLSIALCARIIWGNKKLALAEYELDDLRDSGANTCFKTAYLEEKCDRLEKERDQWANRSEEWRRYAFEQLDARKEAEVIANEAMRVGLETIQNMSTAEWNRGHQSGWNAGILFAAATCNRYPTSRGSTLAKRIAK